MLLISTAFIAPSAYGQEFWYVPPGLDYGARAGINLGYGAGFGYGVGVGFTGNQGWPAVPVFQGNRQSKDPFSNLSEPVDAPVDLPTAVRPTPVQKQQFLKQNLAKKQAMEQRREVVRETARLRNARYIKYLDDQRAAAGPAGKAG